MADRFETEQEYGAALSHRDAAALAEGGRERDDKSPSSESLPLLSCCQTQCARASPSVPDSGRSCAVITPVEARDLLLLALSYTCVASSTTLIVGGSAVVVISVGGGSDLAPIALSSFFAGSSLISLATERLFGNLGRKGGFTVGSVLGMMGGAIGAAAVALSSPTMVVASSFPVGCANGVGQHLRFSAMEVVDDTEDEAQEDGQEQRQVKRHDAKSLAMTLVMSGGCLAAFLGPESQLATRYTFGAELEYLGLFVMVIIFNALCAVLVLFVRFPSTKCEAADENRQNGTSSDSVAASEIGDDTPHGGKQRVSILDLLQRFDFLSSAALACLSWSIMAMPMSIVRVAMNELGYSSRRSLTTLELHFLGMFAPGFVTGGLIQRFGIRIMSWVGLVLFCVAIITNFLSRAEEEGGTVGTWMAGLATLGVGWNVTFASATVMLSETYVDAPAMATKIQAANDFIMFGISGALIVSTGYIFQAGGTGLPGWILLNAVVVSFLFVMLIILLSLAWQSSKRKWLLSLSQSHALELNELYVGDVGA